MKLGLVLYSVVYCVPILQLGVAKTACGPECYPAAYDDSIDADMLEVEDRGIFGDLFLSFSFNTTNKYYLFTRETPEGQLYNNTLDTPFSNFDNTKKTVLIAHGFTSDSLSGFPKVLKDAYLMHYDANIIGVDWSEGSKNLLYSVAVRSVQKCAEQLGAFIDVLATEFNLPPEELHLIGHSLGAHVVGLANHHVKTGNVGRVTGLDPAAPLYHNRQIGERISTESGNFVDIIHTCGRLLGLFAPLGHVDFYSHKGVATQPGCSLLDTLKGGMCSHSKAWVIYIDSIENPIAYKAIKCDNYDFYEENECANNSFTYLGEETDKTVTGVHYFNAAH